MANLTIEQEASLQVFAQQVRQLSEPQTKDFLLKLYHQMIVKDALYQRLLKPKISPLTPPCE
ncbi:MAG: hypothetical protein SNJ57_12045 [Cyanobacteriota bacterium]